MQTLLTFVKRNPEIRLMNKPPANKAKELMLPDEVIMDKIHLMRGHKIMLDRDLSELYGSKTKVLKQQVKRNLNMFPEDYMFELTREEFSNWRSQFVTSKSGRMGKPKPQVAPTHKPGWKTCGCGAFAA